MDLFNNYAEAYAMAQALDKKTEEKKKTKKTNKSISNDKSPHKKKHCTEDSNDDGSVKTFDTKSSQSTNYSTRRPSHKNGSLLTMIMSEDDAIQESLGQMRQQTDHVVKDLRSLILKLNQQEEGLNLVIQMQRERGAARLNNQNTLGALLSAKKMQKAQLEQKRLAAAIEFLHNQEEAVLGHLQTTEDKIHQHMEVQEEDDPAVLFVLHSTLTFDLGPFHGYQARVDAILGAAEETSMTDEELLNVLKESNEA